MLDLLAGFVGELRAAGLPVSLTENIDAEQAKDTLHILLKYQSDITKAEKELSSVSK